MFNRLMLGGCHSLNKTPFAEWKHSPYDEKIKIAKFIYFLIHQRPRSFAMKHKHTYVTKACSICLMGPSGDQTSPANVKHGDSQVTAHLTTTAVEPGNSAAKTQKQQGTQHAPWSHALSWRMQLPQNSWQSKAELLEKLSSWENHQVSACMKYL